MRKYGVIIGVLIALCITGGGFLYSIEVWPPSQSAAAANFKTPEEKESEYVRFVMEGYDLIQKNYWQKAEDSKLANHFQLSLEKAAATSSAITATDRASTAKMLAAAFDGAEGADAKKNLAVGILQVALYNLAPQGRNQLLSAEEQKEVQNTVNNVNPSTGQAEPTVFSKGMGSTLYISIGRMSPVTVSEFTAILETASSTPYSSIIIDLRGNIGGALDQIPVFLGLFLGANQYAFDLYHQDNFEVIRSPVGKLAALDRYKEVVILTDNMSQSSAEVFSAAAKRFGIATIVGTNTRGWGTVEGTYQIETKIDEKTTYGLMLVYGLTLREDNQPIDGVGVSPDVNTGEKNWQTQLSQHIRSPGLVEAVRQAVSEAPQR
ncbi:hypothetical protein C4568_01785 [Candidatus Parcubacteria bacterium]|nr:MAG: hypothetical protein C4568_01785 [Candidatus Parcubacteria bacterium]